MRRMGRMRRTWTRGGGLSRRLAGRVAGVAAAVAGGGRDDGPLVATGGGRAVGERGDRASLAVALVLAGAGGVARVPAAVTGVAAAVMRWSGAGGHRGGGMRRGR